MAGQNVDLFDTYFRRADLDRDGRISGNEAVSFFLGSGLPKPVLAQIWVHADQHRTGFLGRAEFYNALKLVTVAQSKWELTPDIVKAALYGPASAKIPAPQINLSATPAPPTNPAAGAAVPQLSGVAQSPSQNMGVRGPQVPSSATMGPKFFPPQQNQMGRPPRPATPNTAFQPQQVVASQGMPGMGTTAASQGLGTNNSSDWLGGMTAGSPVGVTTQVANRGIQPLTTSAQHTPNANSGLVQPPSSRPNDPILPSSHMIAKDSKQLAGAGNGFASSDSVFGDVFSVTSSQPKQDALLPASSPGSLPVAPAIVSASTGLQSAAKPSPLGSLQSAFSQQPVGSQNQKGNQQVSVQSSAAFNSSNAGFPASAGIPPSGQSQVPWPRMTQSDVQKYTKVFVEVDTDRDGKITGDQARNLFLSWRLPREILKQVWDLSDQDSDSMLSVREFCIALYLMERYRDGRPLPKTLPNGMFDETLFSASGQPAAAYGNATWRPTPGFQQAQAMPGAPPVTHVARGRPPKPVPVPLPDDVMQSAQQKSKVPVLEKHLVTQLSEEEQNALTTKFEDATVANKKVEELEKEILDAREKNEFYRSKMQELILYKSRCDNRLNEIIERTSADKREAESLAKKYEEKYKQTGDVASKLPLEEATFRDIQEKKMELYRAIVKMGQDGKPDNVEANADRIQSELEELVKSLNERCKSYGLRAKPTTLVELPFGWQSGLQEGAADWDENWDKFEDEGFAFVKELTLDVQNIVAPPKQKSLPVGKSSSAKEGVDVQSRNADSRSETLANGGERVPGDDHNEEGVARSPPESPAHSVDSPSQKSPDSRKNFNADGSPHASEYQSEHGGAESVFSGDKGFDERSFTAFDTNYDTDSAWDFGSGPTKAMDYSGSAFFDAGDLGLPPIRTDSSHQKKSPFAFGDSVTSTPLFNSGNSPQADNIYQKNTFVFDSVPSTPQTDNLFPRKSTYAFDSVPSTPQADNLFQKKSTFAFDSVPSTPQADNLFQNKSAFSFDSVPSTPLSDNLFQQKSTFAFDSVPSTPAYNYSNEENAFDSFSRFDSFNESSRGFPPQGSFTRFDSMSSTRDFDNNQGFFPPKDSFARFDSFSSTADSEINTQGFFPTKDYARFDSIRSTADYSDNSHGFHSFDDADPFGSSGPFKTSVEAQTPRRDSDQWRAF